MHGMMETLCCFREQQVGSCWYNPSRTHAAMAFAATIIINMRWNSSLSRVYKTTTLDDAAPQLLFVVSTSLTKRALSSNDGAVVQRRVQRSIEWENESSTRSSDGDAAEAIAETIRNELSGTAMTKSHWNTFPSNPIADHNPSTTRPQTANAEEIVTTYAWKSCPFSAFACSAAVAGSVYVGSRRKVKPNTLKSAAIQLVAMFVLFPEALVQAESLSSSENLAAEASLRIAASKAQTVISEKVGTRRQNLSQGVKGADKLPVMSDGDILASQSSTSSRGYSLPSSSSGSKRKKWVSHVSSTYTVRKYQVMAIWLFVLFAACLIYWSYLRDHIPPGWAASFCALIFLVGLLYNAESNNIVNELLTFVIGMTAFGVIRILTHRNVLHKCQCRLCEREVVISSKLGEGSFGTVYKARTTHRASEGAGLACVVKRVPVDLDKDINDASEALQEAKSLLKLEAHPHIVSYMDVWLHRDNPVSPFKRPTTEVCLMMEFCSNGDLFDKLETERAKPGGISDKILYQWCSQIADAVAFIHSKGITHCDLKLENIFLSEKDAVKVGDFGLSLQLKRRRTAQSPSVLAGPAEVKDALWGSTKMGSRGTPDYMAPECWGSCSKYTPKVDVWSVGVIFYIMLTGKTPTHQVGSKGKGNEEEEVMLGQLAKDSVRGNDGRGKDGMYEDYYKELDGALALVPDVGIRDMLRRMLHPDPPRRPPMMVSPTSLPYSPPGRIHAPIPLVLHQSLTPIPRT